jgi:tight adherence protein C
MDLAAAACAAAAFIALALCLFQRSRRRSAALSSLDLDEKEKAATRPRVRFLPLLEKRLSWLGRMIAPRPRGEIAEMLTRSGKDWTPHLFQGLRLGMGLAPAILVLPLGLPGLLLAPVLFAAGYHAPVMALKRGQRRRWDEIARDLPEIVDLMAVLCYSGESLFLALRHSVAACGHTSLREELASILERISLGESASEALRHSAGHPCREMRRFSRTLLRAEEFGSPIADTLEELAVELRSGRREKDRVRASRVSVFILFPLVFLILPSFLLLTVGGMILGYTL